MAKVLLDFTVFPKFNCIPDVDFGPGTTHQIRFSAAQYKALITRYINNPTVPVVGLLFRVQGFMSFTATGPFLNDFESYNFALETKPLGWSEGPTTAINHGGYVETIPNYGSCPLTEDEVTRENADIFRSIDFSFVVNYSLYHPRSEADSWATSTSFWLPFTVVAPPGTVQESYICQPSGEGGAASESSIENNFVGIFYAGDPTGHDFTKPLGDGTTEAYFLDPGTGNKIMITDFVTNQ